MWVLFRVVVDALILVHIVFLQADGCEKATALFGGRHHLVEFVFIFVIEVAPDFRQVIQVIHIILRSTEEQVLSLLLRRIFVSINKWLFLVLILDVVEITPIVIQAPVIFNFLSLGLRCSCRLVVLLFVI